MTIKRKLFYSERLVHLNGDCSHEPITITFILSIKGNIPYERVRIVLDKLQKRHPAFRARVEGDNIFFEDSDFPPIPLQMIERVSEDTWKIEKEKFITEPYDYEKGPLFRVLWVKSDEISDFVFSGLHVIIDWKSCLLIMKEFFTLLNNPDMEVSSYLPIQSLKELMSGASLTWFQKLLVIVWTEIYRWMLIFTSWNKKAPPPQPYRIFLNFSKELTLALTKVAEKNKVSVSSISCILVLKLFKAHFHPKKSKCFIYMTMDIRRFVSTVKKNMVFAFAPKIIPRIKISDDKDILEQARSFDKLIIERGIMMQKKKSSSLFYSFRHILIAAECYNRILNWILNRNIVINEGYEFVFLNLGKPYPLPKNPEFEMNRMFTPEVHLPWYNSTLFGLGYAYEDKVRFSFQSNEHYIPQEEMRTIRSEFEQSVRELVKEELINDDNSQN